MNQLDHLLTENNELLRQVLAEVKKIVREMENLNEMTRKRLPYRWSPRETDSEDHDRDD